MESSPQLLYIGRLISLDLADTRGKPLRTMRTPGRHLCWDVKRKAFVVGRSPRKIRKAKFAGALLGKHRRFHGAAATGAIQIEIPDQAPPAAAAECLISGLTYQVPAHIKAPTKHPDGAGKTRWHHKFGDTRHTGNTDKGTKVMPAFARAGKDLFIMRRKGNIYRVDSWLRG